MDLGSSKIKNTSKTNMLLKITIIGKKIPNMYNKKCQ